MDRRMGGPTDFEPAAARIAAAAPRDAIWLAALMRETFLRAYGAASAPSDVDAHLQQHFAVDTVAAELSSGERPVLVCMLGDRPSGYAQLDLVAPRPAAVDLLQAIELRRFYLLPEAQGSGQAVGLMQAVLALARARHACGLWLSVWQRAERAQRFYARQGFRRVGSTRFRIGTDLHDDWLLARALD